MDSKPGRREILGGLAVGAAAWLQGERLWGAGEDEKVVPFITAPAGGRGGPAGPNLNWEKLTSWVTPEDQFFSVGHYTAPEVDPATWKLDIGGLVSKPRAFSLEELKGRPKKEHIVTLECSGNGPAGGLIGNAKWAGTPLAPILKEAGLHPEGIEVVFFAADSGTEKIRDAEYKQNFARSLSADDALKNGNLFLCYELNGQPLPKAHGGPVRLVVPGSYGVTWVKWINRIEVQDRKYENRFMARDYVTIRGEKRGEDTIWRETSVGKMNLKSVTARVTRRSDGALRIAGAAWGDGTPIKSVEVKIDDEAWKPAQLTPNKDLFAWTFWTLDWGNGKPGEHSITSRATDAHGKIQPTADDPFIALKKTRWENNQQAVRRIRIEG
jgi:DMSO/TMAO reductase YedYZ molybdopterin-dependent catalytic subunit